jgi:hypothetical protein
LHLIAPSAVSSSAAQDVLFGARMDEQTQQERLRMKLPSQAPLFAPDAVLPSDPIQRAVLEQRKAQWLLQERERYFSDQGAPMAPAPAAPKPKPAVDAVVQVVQEAGYEDFGFMIVRLDYSDETVWERWKAAVDIVLDQSVDECLGGDQVKDKLMTMFVEDEDLQGTGWDGAVTYVDELKRSDVNIRQNARRRNRAN